jgi:hypothetical protein
VRSHIPFLKISASYKDGWMLLDKGIHGIAEIFVGWNISIYLSTLCMSIEERIIIVAGWVYLFPGWMDGIKGRLPFNSTYELGIFIIKLDLEMMQDRWLAVVIIRSKRMSSALSPWMWWFIFLSWVYFFSDQFEAENIIFLNF